MNSIYTPIANIFREIANVDSQLIMLVVFIVSAVIVLDSFSLTARRKRQRAGISIDAVLVSVDGGKSIPVKNYVSEIQGLAGRPDALISEGGFIIPIERKPLARKLRDRYVAQILVYMRLVEEFEGKRPPYGYLILGPNARRIRIDNTEERQRWLDEMVQVMRGIVGGAQCKPDPHPKKCELCDVNFKCLYRSDKQRIIHS